MAKKPVCAEAFHPGRYIRGELEARNITEMTFYSQLAEMGICMHYMMDVLREKRPVNNIVAIGLSQIFDTGSEVWLNLQKAYDEHPTVKAKEESDDVES